MTTAPPVLDFVRPFQPWMTQCEEMLSRFAGGHVPEVSGPAMDTLVAGGKRVRPMMVFCCSSRTEEFRLPLVSAAAAVELVCGIWMLADWNGTPSTVRATAEVVMAGWFAINGRSVRSMPLARCSFTWLTRISAPLSAVAARLASRLMAFSVSFTMSLRLSRETMLFFSL